MIFSKLLIVPALNYLQNIETSKIVWISSVNSLKANFIACNYNEPLRF